VDSLDSADGGANPAESEDDVATIDGAATADPNGPDAGMAPDLTTIILRNEKAPTTPPQFVIVLVSSPEGDRIDAARTDADGKVQVSVPPGSTVTTIAESNYTVDGEPNSDTSIVSWFDVPEVDTMHLGIAKRSGEIVLKPTEPVAVGVTLVSERPGVAGDSGELFLPCNGTYYPANGATVGFVAEFFNAAIKPCPGATDVEVWGFARGGWAYGTIAFAPDSKPHIELPAEDLLWDTSSLRVQGIPMGAQRVNYGVWAAMRAGSPGYYRGNSATLPSTEEVLEVQVPRAQLHHVNLGAFVLVQEQPGIEAYAAREAAEVTDLDWNASQDLALIETVSLLPREIASRPEVTWKVAAVGELGDYAEVSLQWRDVSWVAHVPAARRGRVQLPELPAGPDRYAPWPDDEVLIEGVSVTDDLLLGDRSRIFDAVYARSENYNTVSYSP
jgi:hypothetical protein